MIEQRRRAMSSRIRAPEDGAQIIEIRAAGAGAGEPSVMAAIFNTQRRLDKWLARRRLWARAIVVASVPMAALLNAGVAPSGLVRAVLSLWLLCFACCCVCAEAALRAGLQLDRLLGSAGARPLDHIAGSRR
jgi:hypothetical protein